MRPSSADYVIELLSDRGKRQAILGRTSNGYLAHECYEAALRDYPYTCVRMRQGKQTIAMPIPERFVHEPQGQWLH